VISLQHSDTAVSATRADRELFRYVCQPGDPQLESPRPYFHPVRPLRGHPVTIYRPHDHVWHKGIALSLRYDIVVVDGELGPAECSALAAHAAAEDRQPGRGPTACAAGSPPTRHRGQSRVG
jgi:Family of unknown function (DUF6807)